jgi:hypothetical protein
MTGKIAGREMVKMLPGGLLRELHAGTFAQLANLVGHLTTADPATVKPEDCFGAANFAGDLGIALVWDFE